MAKCSNCGKEKSDLEDGVCRSCRVRFYEKDKK